MTKYEIMYEALQEKVNSGELTVEDAEILNDIAYEKYGKDMTDYTESSEEGMTYEEYLDIMEGVLFGNKNKTTGNTLYDEMKAKNKEFIKNEKNDSKNREKFNKNLLKTQKEMQGADLSKKLELMKKTHNEYNNLMNNNNEKEQKKKISPMNIFRSKNNNDSISNKEPKKVIFAR